MPWTNTPCDLVARDAHGQRTSRIRRSRVSSAVLKRLWSEHHCAEWPLGYFACHRCDEPRCSNVEHVFPGTASDNIRDAVRKNRMSGSIHGAGERHRFARLTWNSVHEIRKRYASGESQHELAAAFAIHRSAISRIVNGKRWVGGESNPVAY